jgi:hypothetical protein
MGGRTMVASTRAAGPKPGRLRGGAEEGNPPEPLVEPVGGGAHRRDDDEEAPEPVHDLRKGRQQLHGRVRNTGPAAAGESPECGKSPSRRRSPPISNPSAYKAFSRLPDLARSLRAKRGR